MKYEAPYGVSDPNASYINGNPATGTMGSIPPAASIENPQREIVNFITASALTPTDADLLQLGRAVQGGYVNFGIDVGAVNRPAISPSIPITAYGLGQRFFILLKYANTSTVQVNVSGVGWLPLLHFDRTQINAGELVANQLIEIAYDGTEFIMIAGGAPGGVVTLTAPRDFYLNAATGDDNLYDGTSPNISGTNTGPFKTLQKALSMLQKYNLGGWSFGIHFADGLYISTADIGFPMPNGAGQIYLVGNKTNPSAVHIANNGTGTCWYIGSGGNWNIEGFMFSTTAPQPGDPGNCIWAAGASIVNLGINNFSYVAGYHLCCGPLGGIYVNDAVTISGSAIAHQYAFANGVIYNNSTVNPPLTITIAAPMTTAFLAAGDGGQLRPLWGTITGFGNISGSKYVAASNGVIESMGRGVSYQPGTTAGTTSTGGQYV